MLGLPRSPLRDFTPSGGGGIRKQRSDASISSMERALRTLSSASSPVPQTPRPTPGFGGNNGGRPKKFPSYKPSAGPSSKPTMPIERTKSSGGGDDGGGEEAVKVAIRVRPLAPGGDQCAGRAWRSSSERNSIVEISGGGGVGGGGRRSSGDSEYVYDRVFGEGTNTCEIYSSLVADMVESTTKKGVNGTVFTYGQTSSGKTFTMQGCNDPESSTVGIIQLAAKDIFQSIKEEQADDSNTECAVRVSYMEIYNEELRDLLNDNNRRTSTSLTIREDKRGSIYVEGLKEVAVTSLEQLMEVFRVGERNKAVGSTKMNDRSSRSHAILKIIVERKTVLNPRGAASGGIDDGDGEDKENSLGSNAAAAPELVVKTTSALNLVDLAGSESVRHTGASGMQKKEGGMINQSLLTLSKVLMSLGQKNPGHINYRDSKLTRILKPSLSGNARMAVICCISPSDKYVEETRSTLQFASRAKLVKTNAVANEEVEDADLVAKLRLESAKAKFENRKLEERLRQMERINSTALTTERELANLKAFVFSGKAKGRSPSGRVSRRLSFGEASPSSPASQNGAKDDSSLRPNENDPSSGEILRLALEFKAKQVESLQKKLMNSKPGKESKASRDKRYSLISEVRSPDVDRRISLINSQGDLELKLANANSLIEGLQRQVDDLTSQKNDALDWIEELFAKSDLKDEKLKHACGARDDAVKKCEKLEVELSRAKEVIELSSSENEKLLLEVEDANAKIVAMAEDMDSIKSSAATREKSAAKVEELYLELATAKEKYEASQDELSQVRMENIQLLQDQRDADIKISDLEGELKHLESSERAQQSPDTRLEQENAELKSQVQELEAFASEYAEEKSALIQQIEQYEEELSQADALLKTKTDELDDAMFSLDEERKKWANEKWKADASQHSSTDMELKRVKEENDALNKENEELQAEAIERYQKMEHLRSQLADEATKLREENGKLVSEKTQLADECKDLVAKVSDLSTQLLDAQQDLQPTSQHSTKRASREVLDLREDNQKVRAELDHLADDLNTCRMKMEEVSRELRDANQELEEANRDRANLEDLREENEKLKDEHLVLKDDYNDCVKRVVDLTNELAATHRQLEDAKQSQVARSRANYEADSLRLENTRLRAERRDLTKDFDDCCQKIDEMSNEMVRLQQQVQDVEEEKSKLVEELCDANAKVKEVFGQLQVAKKELNTQGQAKAQLMSSVTRIQELVDDLSSENADLKEKNESFMRTRDCLEKRSNELQSLLSTANAERDLACDEMDSVKKSRDAALQEKEVIRMKLDKIAAEFEADYEVIRSRIDVLLREKTDLEERVIFLQASKASVEDNADRILERDNALGGQHDRLKAEFKKQTLKVAELQDEVDQLAKRLASLKSENERLSRDNSCLKDMQSRAEPLLDESNGKRRVIFGFRGGNRRDSR